MKYQKQLNPRHAPDEGLIGDCLRTCVASLLDLEARDVPNFVEKSGKVNDDWHRDLTRWLRARGLAWIEFPYPADGLPVYHIVTGASPRGSYLHCCVGLKGAIVMDPHPDGMCLRDRQFAALIAPKDVGRWRRA